MVEAYRYTRHELSQAVAASRSWRGVLRALDRSATSAGAQRSVRRQVEAFGIDHSHFTGQRRWSDRELVEAVAEARSWREVLTLLGVSDLRGDLRAFRTHAARLGIDTSHLSAPRPETRRPVTQPRLSHLRVAGASLAAAWFMLRGYQVLWPLEPCRCDLGVEADGAIERIQVKTATRRDTGSFMAQLSNTRRTGPREVYDVDEIDSFFVIDAALDAYLIPFADVAGYGTISLRSYRRYLVAEKGDWLHNAATSP